MCALVTGVQTCALPIFHCDHAGRIANAVRARRTGRDNGVVRAHQAIFNTDLPRNQVDETTMNEMWGNAARSLFVENNGLALNTWKAANTRADRAARTQALSFAHISPPRLFKRLARPTDADDETENRKTEVKGKRGQKREK